MGFVTLKKAVEHEVDINVIKKLLGHKDILGTAIYYQHRMTVNDRKAFLEK